METKEVDDEPFSIMRYIKYYFLVFGSYFLVTSMVIGFSVWATFHFYGEAGMMVYGLCYAVCGIILGGLFSFSIILRTSAIFAVCNLIRFLIAFVIVLIIWVYSF